MEINCKSLFKGNASIGSQFLDEATKTGEDIVIIHKKKKMTVRDFMFFKFFEMGKRSYRHKDGRPGSYRLKYIQWKADES